MIFLVVLVLPVALTVAYAGQRLFRSNRLKQTKKLPGLDRCSKINGNQKDIDKAGSLHKFLQYLHGRFGPIAKFWYGKTQVVSIASPELFKEHHKAFDKPGDLFPTFSSLMGTKSLLYANGSDARTRRHKYQEAFYGDLLCAHCPYLNGVAEDIIHKWLKTASGDQIPLTKYTRFFAMKCTLWALFGDKFENDEHVFKLQEAYATVFNDMDYYMFNPNNTNLQKGKHFDESLNVIQSIFRKALNRRKQNGSSIAHEKKLIDILLEVCADEEMSLHEAVFFSIPGFHNNANALAWVIYFLATNKHVQDKLFKEVTDILGEKGTVDRSNFSQFKYMTQVIDETLRCAVIAPWTARVQDCETKLGGYEIPANTPVFHALGVVLQDEKIWPQPKRFDPDRFLEKNLKEKEPFSFPAFGFAGNRKCPAYKFAYWGATVFLADIVRRFHINCCNQEPVKQTYGFVCRPKDEIWIQVTERK